MAMRLSISTRWPWRSPTQTRALCRSSRPLVASVCSFSTRKHGHHEHRSSLLFGFVRHVEDKKDLVAKSRETLRFLSRGDDHVHLHLPSTRSTATPHGLHRTAVIEVSNPAARNALSGRMMAELADIVRELEKPEVQASLNAVVITGTAGWFCAGADLQVAKKELSSNEAGTAMSALMGDTLTRLRRLPMVSVAVIEGGAFGGGAEIATVCDFRIMEHRAVLQFVQARMGVSPGWGGGARLLGVVGRQKALLLLARAQKVTSAEAVELCLADAVFDRTESDQWSAIHLFLKEIDAMDSEVLHGAKQVISHADDVSVEQVLEREHEEFQKLWGGPANRRALESALTKQKKDRS